jgi:hypothetical protein
MHIEDLLRKSIRINVVRERGSKAFQSFGKIMLYKFAQRGVSLPWKLSTIFNPSSYHPLRFNVRERMAAEFLVQVERK